MQPGDPLPHFEVTTVDGERIRYDALWQRKNVVIVSLADLDGAGGEYVAHLRSRWTDLTAYDTAVVITRDRVGGVPQPGVVIADRWGEVHFVHGGASARDLPSTGELMESLRYVQSQCPECQGEAR